MTNVSPALDLEVAAARIFLADSQRPSPGPFMSLPEREQRRYRTMAQVAADMLREAWGDLEVEVTRGVGEPAECKVSRGGKVIFDGLSRDSLAAR